jgi:hypothetical protein
MTYAGQNITAMYYRQDDVLMGVAVARGTQTFEFGPPAQVMAGIGNLRTESGISYDVDPKAERFLMIRRAGGNAAVPSLRLIVNWHRDSWKRRSSPR